MWSGNLAGSLQGNMREATIRGKWKAYEWYYRWTSQVLCETPRTLNNFPKPPPTSTKSNTISSGYYSFFPPVTHSISNTSTFVITDSLTPSPTDPHTPTRTVSTTPSPADSLTPSPTDPHTPKSTSPTPNGHPQCFDGPLAIKPAMFRAPDLLVNGEFVFTIAWSLIPHAGKVLESIVEGLLGMGTADTIHVAKCNMTTSERHAEHSYHCRFPPPSASLPINMSSIFLRYMPSRLSWCPLRYVGVVQLPKRKDNVSSSTPVCPVMTNGLRDGSVFVIVAGSPCAPKQSQ